MSSPTPKPKAYSYLRFSTPEQQKGDSLRRQTAMALEYARRNGLELDLELTFQDLGVSAFRGQNAEAGRLAYFLEAVRTGLVPQGSVLLVEQLDRLSRLTARRAMRVLEDIVDAGVAVATLNDNRVYTAELLDTREGSTDLMVALLTFMRANDESETKSRRLKQAWENKRANLASRPLTSRVPAWLRLNKETNRLELVPERAAIVLRIFEMTAAGMGHHKIAETFNLEEMAPWGPGKRWHRTYIAKTLGNPAVVGTLQPQTLEYEGNKKTRKPLDPVEGYYPPAIPMDLWKDVQAMMAVQRAPTRGRHASQPITNLLAGMATCPLCGGTATRVQKGSRSVPSLVCARAKAKAGCTYKSVRYEWVETAILERLPARLKEAPAGAGADAIDDKLIGVEEEMDRLRSVARNLVLALSEGHSSELAAKLRETESQLEAVSEEHLDLLERRAASSGPLVGQRIQTLIKALEAREEPEVINRAMRGVFNKAVVNYTTGELEFEWTHGGTCEVSFMWPDERFLTANA